MSTYDERREDALAWYASRQERGATYTDGTRVQEGDRIRYHQAPGGIFAPGDWRYGEATVLSQTHYGVEFTEMFLRDDTDGHHYGIYGHVIERAER